LSAVPVGGGRPQECVRGGRGHRMVSDLWACCSHAPRVLLTGAGVVCS
jgi:hypothetical protein